MSSERDSVKYNLEYSQAFRNGEQHPCQNNGSHSTRRQGYSADTMCTTTRHSHKKRKHRPTLLALPHETFIFVEGIKLLPCRWNVPKRNVVGSMGAIPCRFGKGGLTADLTAPLVEAEKGTRSTIERCNANIFSLLILVGWLE